MSLVSQSYVGFSNCLLNISWYVLFPNLCRAFGRFEIYRDRSRWAGKSLLYLRGFDLRESGKEWYTVLWNPIRQPEGNLLALLIVNYSMPGSDFPFFFPQVDPVKWRKVRVRTQNFDDILHCNRNIRFFEGTIRNLTCTMSKRPKYFSGNEHSSHDWRNLY